MSLKKVFFPTTVISTTILVVRGEQGWSQVNTRRKPFFGNSTGGTLVLVKIFLAIQL